MHCLMRSAFKNTMAVTICLRSVRRRSVRWSVAGCYHDNGSAQRMTTLKLAVIQQAPAYLHRDVTVSAAIAAIVEAAARGAKLVVFPEAFIPGYPAWIWRLRPGADYGLSTRLHALLLENA